MMRAQTVWRIWAAPLMFGVLIIFGLLSALLGGGGVWWGLCWAALAAPLIAMVRFALKARASRRRHTMVS
ncbi:hypothetical protein [Bradyrhizobium sp.]|uniref:hypothetical protein n=1 Tax=Bradyrhizobium sp. TaxID=376 RepID=UPI0039E44B4B